jgi:hypothetical protein
MPKPDYKSDERPLNQSHTGGITCILIFTEYALARIFRMQVGRERCYLKKSHNMHTNSDSQVSDTPKFIIGHSHTQGATLIYNKMRVKAVGLIIVSASHKPNAATF